MIMIKKYCSVFLTLIILTACFPAFVRASGIGSVCVGETEDLGRVLTNTNSVRCACAMKNGIPIGVSVTPGYPSLLNIVDLNTMRLVEYMEIPNCTSTVWMMQTHSDGNVYFGSYTKARLYRYSPSDNSLTELAVLSGEGAVISMCFNNNDIYLGTYPGCKIMKYSLSENTLSDLGSMDQNEQYLQAMTYHGGYLYYQTKYNNQGLYRYDLSSSGGDPVEVIPFQKTIEDIAEMQTAGKYIVMIGTTDGARKLILYNTETGRWSYFGKNITGRHITPELNNCVYYNDNGSVYKLDLSLMLSSQVSGMTYGSGLQGSGFIELSDPEMPGKNYINIAYSGSYQVWNFAQKRIKSYPCVIQGAASETRAFDFGPDGRLYVGEYMGTKAAALNVDTGDIELFHMAQPEGICSLGDKVYFGNYTGAKLYILDTKQPYYLNYDKNDPSCNPRIWGETGSKQDRPFKLIAAGDKIVQASFPDYGELGGALSIYDPETDEMDVYRNIVNNQSPMSLAYRNGKIFFGTSVSGGLGIYPAETDAGIGIFDLETRSLTNYKTLELEGITEKIKGIEGICYAPDNTLLINGRGYIAKINPETLNVINYVQTGSIDYGNGMQIWWPNNLIYDGERDIFYITLNGKLTLLDYRTLEYRMTDVDSTTCMVMGPDKNIYYIDSGYHIRKINVVRNGFYIANYAGGSVSDINIVSSLESTVKRFVNNYCTFSNGVPEPIRGLKYIQTNYADKDNSAYKSDDGSEWMRIVFDRSSTVYYITSTTYVSARCQKFIYDWNGSWIRDENGEIRFWAINGEANWIRKNVYIYKMEVEVPEGETRILSIPAMGSGSDNAMWSLAIDDGGKPSGELVMNNAVFSSNLYVDLENKLETRPTAILFSEAEESVGMWQRDECGMLLSENLLNKNSFNIDNPDIIKIKNTDVSANDKKFGIMFIADRNSAPKEYYAVSYGIYKHTTTGETKILYGDTVKSFLLGR